MLAMLWTLAGLCPLQDFRQAAHGITLQAVLICHTQSCEYAGGRWCTSCKAAHQRASPKTKRLEHCHRADDTAW